MKRQYSLLHILAAVLIAVAITLATVSGMLYHSIGGREGAELLGKTNAVRKLISETYVGTADWTAEGDGAASALIASLGDRWSYYMTADEYEAYQNYSANVSTGIGVTVRTEEDGGFQVLSVAAGSPAEEAGVEPGWIIASVDGESVLDMDTTALKALLFGKEGEFEVGFFTDGSREQSFLALHTASFFSSPVSYELLEGGIGYIDIDNFESGAAENAISAIEELGAQGAQAYIFDVRANPGGKLSELVELLDYLLPEGELFISLGRDGEEEIYSSDESCFDMPMAVLLDANSYSAAEFFAAALSEYGWAETVGQPSTGKGRSQVTYVLSDGSAVHISTRRYLTPDRIDLSEVGGLTPDICVEMTDSGDAQIEAARKYLS